MRPTRPTDGEVGVPQSGDGWVPTNHLHELQRLCLCYSHLSQEGLPWLSQSYYLLLPLRRHRHGRRRHRRHNWRQCLEEPKSGDDDGHRLHCVGQHAGLVCCRRDRETGERPGPSGRLGAARAANLTQRQHCNPSRAHPKGIRLYLCLRVVRCSPPRSLAGQPSREVRPPETPCRR